MSLAFWTAALNASLSVLRPARSSSLLPRVVSVTRFLASSETEAAMVSAETFVPSTSGVTSKVLVSSL